MAFLWYMGTGRETGRWREREGDVVCMLSASLLLRTLIISPHPDPMTSLNLNYFLRGFISKYGHAVRGVRASVCEFGGHKPSVHNSFQDGIFT